MKITARQATPGTTIVIPLAGLGGHMTATVVRWVPAETGYAHLIASPDGTSEMQMGMYTADEEFRLTPR